MVANVLLILLVCVCMRVCVCACVLVCVGCVSVEGGVCVYVGVCGVWCWVSMYWCVICLWPLTSTTNLLPHFGPYLTPTMAPIPSWVGCPALAIHSPRVKTVRTCTILATKPVVQIKLNA